MNALSFTSVLAIVLSIASSPLRGGTYPISFHLEQAGNVSVAVYNADGAIVREILRASPRTAGDHTVIWDGLDRTGKAVAAGDYSWKLLATPGLSTQYLLRLGSNYPVGTDLSSSSGPGTHNGAFTVAVDDTGTYISALQTENIETCMLKLGPDGEKRLWNQKLPLDAKNVAVAWEAAWSIAVDDGEIYLLGHQSPPRIFISNASTGEGVGRAIDIKPDADEPNPTAVDATDMDVHDGVLVVAYPARNLVRWFDPRTGASLDRVTIPSPQGVTVAEDGIIYATTGDSIVGFTREKHELVTVIKGLDNPGRIDIDHVSGDLFVALGGASQQIVRISTTTGEILRTYGSKGGRKDGLYVPEDFYDVTDVCADGKGGFYMTEAFIAPRRVAHFDGEGKLLREWYGGQRWAPHADFEAGDPGAAWMTSTPSRKGDKRSIMRMVIDYEKKSWRVHSCYHFVSPENPLMHDSSNESGLFRVYRHGETKYLVMESSPCVWKIDEKNWKLIPVTSVSGDFQWNDANGDGLVQENEKTKLAAKMPSSFYVSHIDANFDHYFIDTSDRPFRVKRMRVASWNAQGAPVYGEIEAFGDCPPRFNNTAYADGRWGAFLYHDTTSGNVYAALNPGTADWCTSADSFMQQWDAKGRATWMAGELGPASRNIMFAHFATEPGLIYWNLRGIAGIAHGCVVAVDVDGGWSVERAQTYVWDQDGLFVGGIMDRVDLNGIPEFLYHCGGEFCHASVLTLPNGDVLFAGNWENDVRVYKVTGWDKWVRQTGKLSVAAAGADGAGQGLTAEYFDDAKDLTHPRAVRADSVAAADWAAKLFGGAAPLSPQTSAVRWRGTVCPTYGPTYTGYWTVFRSAPTETSDGTIHRSNVGDAKVECRFRGTSIRVVGSKDSASGYVNFSIDGVEVAHQVDCYSAAGESGATLFEKTGLADGDHTLTADVVGTVYRPRNPASSNGYVYIDKFIAGDVTIDDDGLPYTFHTTGNAASQLWVDKVCTLYDWAANPAARETVGAPIKMQRRPYPIQFTVRKNAGNEKAALGWSSPMDAKQSVPTAALFPVTTIESIREINIGCVPLAIDTKTQGNWKGVYGADDYYLMNVGGKFPAYVQLAPSGTHFTWWAPGDNVLMPQHPTAAGRVGTAWYCPPEGAMTYDLNFVDDQWHRFSFYTLDKDNLKLRMKFDVFDVAGQLLDSRVIESPTSGAYIGWNLRGHVSIRVTPIKPSAHAIVLGLFFDPPSEMKR